MAKLALALFFFCCVMHGMSSPPPTKAIDCSNALVSLADCLTFVEEGSKEMKPQGQCCHGLKKVVKEEVSCLCEAFKGSADYGVKLNMSKALTLPSACGFNPPFSKCNIGVGAPGVAPEAIINKLPPSWMSFCTDMRRRKKQVALENLKRYIRIENEVRTRTNNELIGKQKASAHAVFSKPEFKKKTFKKKPFKGHYKSQKKPFNLNIQKKDFKKTGNFGNYFNCGKEGYFAKSYKAHKKQNVNQVAQVQNFVTMIFVTKHTPNDDWWLDIEATCHVCANKSLFTTYVPSKRVVEMADQSTAAILEIGTVILSLTSEKTHSEGCEACPIDYEEFDLWKLYSVALVCV